MKRPPFRQLLKVIGSTLLTLALFALVLKYLNLRDLVHAMAHVNGVWLGATMSLLVVYQFLRAIRIAALVGTPLPTARLFNTTCTQALLNLVLPMGLGEASLVILLKTRHQVGPHRGTAVWIVSRVLDVMAVCGLYLIVFLLARDSQPPEAQLIVRSLLLLLLVGTVALWATLRFSAFERRTKSAALAFVQRHVQILRAALIEVLSRRALVRAGALSIAMWVVMFGFYYSSVRTLGFSFDVLSFVFVHTLIALVWAVPVRGVAYAGTHHASWFLALRVLNVDACTAALIATGTHLIMTACISLLALVPLGFAALDRLRSWRQSRRGGTQRSARSEDGSPGPI